MMIKTARFWIVCGFHAGVAADVLLLYFGLWRKDPTYAIRAQIASAVASIILGPYPPVNGLRFDDAFFLFKLITGGLVGAVTGGVLFAGCLAVAHALRPHR